MVIGFVEGIVELVPNLHRTLFQCKKTFGSMQKLFAENLPFCQNLLAFYQKL